MPLEKAVDIPAFYGYNVKAFASVAQSVVHLTRNEKVACSSQVTSSKKLQVIGLELFFVLLQTIQQTQYGFTRSSVLK